MTARFCLLLACLALAPLLTAFQDAPPYHIGNGVSAPVPIEKTQPAYTEEAKQAKIQGTVQLSLTVDEFGVPTDIAIDRSLDAGLDTQAIEAVKQWRFKPGMKDGKPVAVRAVIEVGFKLL